MRLEEETLLDGRYLIKECIGVGLTGTVYRAVDKDADDRANPIANNTANNSNVALKIFSSHLVDNEQAYLKFRNELRIAKTLNHPQIVHIHEVGRDAAGLIYMSMEYVVGDTLSSLLHIRTDNESEDGEVRYRSLSVGRAVKILEQIVSGVAFAHDRQVIHGDLNPSNIIVSLRDEVKLLDFGISRVLSSVSSVFVKEHLQAISDYAAPEQRTGGSIDERVDVYALGMIAYEMVFDKATFVSPMAIDDGSRLSEQVLSHSSGEDIPEWYRSLLARALAFDRHDRFSSVLEMMKLIEAANSDSLRSSSRGLGLLGSARLMVERESPESQILDPNDFNYVVRRDSIRDNTNDAVQDNLRGNIRENTLGHLDMLPGSGGVPTELQNRRRTHKYRKRGRWIKVLEMLIASALVPIIAILAMKLMATLRTLSVDL